MRKKLLLLILWGTISSLWGASLGLAQGVCTLTVSGAGSFSTGSNVILTAVASGTCQPISQVTFYNGTTVLGSSSSSPYSFTWNTAGVPIGVYSNVYAVASYSGSVGSSGATVIDVVGSPSFGGNPGSSASFGEGGVGSWAPADNQRCSVTTATSPYGWPYNGATSSIPDGTCELNGTTVPPPPTTPTTIDSLDDTMHTLSDFVNFANQFLGQSIGSLSASFDTWYPQVIEWIDPTTGRLTPLAANLNAWNTVITNWLGQNYTNVGSWCVPPEATVLNGNASTAEDTYINTTSNTIAFGNSTTWGDLPHVITCMDYNSNLLAGTAQNSSVYNYQQCVTALTSGSCPASLPAQCAASSLGRSLLGTAAPAYDGCSGNYWTWVNSSFTLATDEAPKFALRGAFLTDVFNRAETMKTIFPPAATALQNFLSGPAAQLMAVQPCGDGSTCSNGKCSDGSSCGESPTTALPNSVIYGWVDNTYPNGRPGAAHIVKVTAYAASRNGSDSNGTTNVIAQAVLPWIKTTVHLFTRDYTLRNRDGDVYVSVKRWDQDHSNSLLFPNGHPLWQFLFHNPNGASTTTGQGLPSACIGPGGYGFGLEPLTVSGLQNVGLFQSVGVSSIDQTALSNAFMLNDEGTGANAGKVDPSVLTDSGNYLSCLSQVNKLLDTAPESHACVRYVASSPSSDASSVNSGNSQDGDADYALKFVDCKSVPGYPPPDDLTYGE